MSTVTKTLTFNNFDESSPLGKKLFALCEQAEEAEAVRAEVAGDDDYEAAYERARSEFEANFDHYHRLAFRLLSEDEQDETLASGYGPPKVKTKKTKTVEINVRYPDNDAASHDAVVRRAVESHGGKFTDCNRVADPTPLSVGAELPSVRKARECVKYLRLVGYCADVYD